MARAKSVLVSNSKQSVAFQVKIDQEVVDAIKLLEDRIKKVAPSKSFPRTEIVQRALEEAVEAANDELDKLEAEKKGGA